MCVCVCVCVGGCDRSPTLPIDQCVSFAPSVASTHPQCHALCWSTWCCVRPMVMVCDKRALDLQLTHPPRPHSSTVDSAGWQHRALLVLLLLAFHTSHPRSVQSTAPLFCACRAIAHTVVGWVAACHGVACQVVVPLHILNST
jgi:hypothetical protein